MVRNYIPFLVINQSKLSGQPGGAKPTFQILFGDLDTNICHYRGSAAHSKTKSLQLGIQLFYILYNYMALIHLPLFIAMIHNTVSYYVQVYIWQSAMRAHPFDITEKTIKKMSGQEKSRVELNQLDGSGFTTADEISLM